MIRALLTLIKIGIVIAVVVWVAENPGTITVDWLNYKLTFHVGLFLLFMLGVVVLGMFIFSVFKTFFDLPKNLSRYRDIKHKEKGLKALTLGLAAVAAGDKKSAAYQAYRASKFLDEKSALPKLLQAQSARLQGNELDAARAFMELMDDSDASFLGVRGLLQSALDSGDYEGALELGHRALESHPKQGWILSIVYDLEIRARNWDSARKILYRAEKNKTITSEKANSDRVAMYLAEAAFAKENGEEKVYARALNKAYKIDPYFPPSVVRLSRMHIERNKKKAAVTAIRKAWAHYPHPSFVALWEEVRTVPAKDDPMNRVRWFEKLQKLNPESVEGLQAVANILIEEGLWGEARKNLEKAETIRPNVNLYKIWSRLEDRATHNDAAVREWLEKASDAPRERVWICSETGRVYDQWMPISDQELFNTIIWDFPQGRRIMSSTLIGNTTAGQSAVPLLGS